MQVILYKIFLCVTSLNTIISTSIHVAANGIISHFFMAEYYSIVCKSETLTLDHVITAQISWIWIRYTLNVLVIFYLDSQKIVPPWHLEAF